MFPRGDTLLGAYPYIEVSMNNQLIIYILIVFSLYLLCAEGNETKGNGQAQLRVDILSTKLKNYEILRVEILQIPPGVLTRTRITPAMLEKQFDYKLTIRDIRGGAYRDKLVKAIESIEVKSQSAMEDIRWGAIFYDQNDMRVGAIYFNKTGNSGAVGDEPVSFKGDFFKWMDGNFSNCFH